MSELDPKPFHVSRLRVIANVVSVLHAPLSNLWRNERGSTDAQDQNQGPAPETGDICSPYPRCYIYYIDYNQSR